MKYKVKEDCTKQAKLCKHFGIAGSNDMPCVLCNRVKEETVKDRFETGE